MEGPAGDSPSKDPEGNVVPEVYYLEALEPAGDPLEESPEIALGILSKPSEPLKPSQTSEDHTAHKQFRERYWAAAGLDPEELGPEDDRNPLKLLIKALAIDYPPEDATPIEKVRWVAANIHAISDGLEAAGLPHNFGIIYGALTDLIADNFGRFAHQEDLAKTALVFFDYYREPVRNIVGFLQGGDPTALEDVNESWLLTIMSNEARVAGPGIQFLLGMLAHITDEDLESSLEITRPTAEYRTEYNREVGAMILAITRRFAPELIPGHPRVREALVQVVTRVIANRRDRAYRIYLEQRQATADERRQKREQLNREAALTNRVLLRYGSAALRIVGWTERLPGGGRRRSVSATSEPVQLQSAA